MWTEGNHVGSWISLPASGSSCQNSVLLSLAASFWMREPCSSGHPIRGCLCRSFCQLMISGIPLFEGLQSQSSESIILGKTNRRKHGLVPLRGDCLLSSAFIAGSHKDLCKAMGWGTSEVSAKSKRVQAQPNSYVLCVLNSYNAFSSLINLFYLIQFMASLISFGH